MSEQPAVVRPVRTIHHRGGGDAVYGLGFIGAAIYFIGQATTFGLGVLGLLKALVWPVFLVMALLKYLGV
ncbi:MAG: hypothetical protein ABFD24_12395 [Anaerolineaceae bacterium]